MSDSDTENSKHNPLWYYALGVYERPEVAALCLAAQDNWQLDINLLLCAAWLAEQGVCWSDQDCAALLAISEPWQQQCLQPLREARRYLKSNAKPELYAAIKALELDLEAEELWRFSCYVKGLPKQLAVPETLLLQMIQLYIEAANVEVFSEDDYQQWLRAFVAALLSDS